MLEMGGLLWIFDQILVLAARFGGRERPVKLAEQLEALRREVAQNTEHVTALEAAIQEQLRNTQLQRNEELEREIKELRENQQRLTDLLSRRRPRSRS